MRMNLFAADVLWCRFFPHIFTFAPYDAWLCACVLSNIHIFIDSSRATMPTCQNDCQQYSERRLVRKKEHFKKKSNKEKPVNNIIFSINYQKFKFIAIFVRSHVRIYLQRLQNIIISIITSTFLLTACTADAIGLIRYWNRPFDLSRFLYERNQHPRVNTYHGWWQTVEQYHNSWKRFEVISSYVIIVIIGLMFE